MSKKVLAVLLVICMVVSMMPMAMAADEAIEPVPKAAISFTGAQVVPASDL